MSETQVKEKRAHRRVAFPFPVRIGVEGMRGFDQFAAANVSARGVYVSTENPYPVGTTG